MHIPPILIYLYNIITKYMKNVNMVTLHVVVIIVNFL